MTLTRYGIREWGGGGIIALLLLLIFIVVAVYVNPIIGSVPAILTAICWLAMAAFFRNPVRLIPDDPSLLVSPADGVIRDIEIFDSCPIEGFEGKTVRIGIFLSVLDVHLNRAPCDLRVIAKTYREGRYLDARHPDCSKENEALTIAGIGNVPGHTFPVAVRQISGAIARRIVCQAGIDSELERGSIYGMIKFGSRTELFLPATENISVTAAIGDRVYAGKTALAKVL